MSLPCLEQIIEKNTRVRLKIVGTRVDATEIVSILFLQRLQLLTLGQFAIGTIKEDHLGVID
jgi:DNA-directed RNA polymerase II subunit RPB7